MGGKLESMSLGKTYRAEDHEPSIYRLWEESGVFALKGGGQPFVVAMPPPNANADIHIGYALDSYIKDVLIRWRRIRGQPVLLIPGADHAGFETWAVYEKHLEASGKSRFDFERNELYRGVYDFVIKNMTNMKDQVKRLGISCDFGEFTFSLDDKIVKRSYRTFKEMWSRGLIYRGKRLINFCVQHGTGFSDFEVSHREVAGKLYFIRYPLTDGSGSITIATTRPETLLGDVAVAVHPADKRYRGLEGKQLELPLTGRKIPLISDEAVIADFGSGALKITPGHDFVDFEIGERAGLQAIEIIDQKGRITDQAPAEFVGLSVTEARQRVLQRLKEAGCLEKEEAYRHQVGHCYKCGTALEPLLTSQWFVKMQPLAQAAIAELEKGGLKFHPPSKLDELIAYLGQLKDWNISRQIVWGIPIPVFQNQDEPDDWIFDERVDRESLRLDGKVYRRDSDVFDTWWSSGQWPFAAVDWPQRDGLYPNALMETGVDILRPWVSRMILLGFFVTGKLPFETVYLHGMVVDEKGIKMSKSKGNVVNPMAVIKEYGADALRIALCCQLAPAAEQKFNREKALLGRNFCNKLWNIGRFVQEATSGAPEAEPEYASAIDQWIWRRFLETKRVIDSNLENYRLAAAWETLAAFIWHDLADWYLESCKWRLNRPFLRYLFLNCLRLSHPFAPFLSESLYQQLYPTDSAGVLAGEGWPRAWPSSLKAEAEAAQHFEHIRQLIARTRQLLPFELRKDARLMLKSATVLDDGLKELCQRLAGVTAVEEVSQARPGDLPAYRQAGYKAWIRLDPQLLAGHLRKLEKEAAGLASLGQKLRGRLDNANYLAKAPAELIEESRRQLSELEDKKAALEGEIANFRQAL